MPLDIELILKHKDNNSFDIQHSYKARGGDDKGNLSCSIVINFVCFYLQFEKVIMLNNGEWKTNCSIDDFRNYFQKFSCLSLEKSKTASYMRLFVQYLAPPTYCCGSLKT